MLGNVHQDGQGTNLSVAGHCVLQWLGHTVHQMCAEQGGCCAPGDGCVHQIYNINKIFPHPRAETSKLEAGESSGELMDVAYCYQVR